MTLRSWLRLLAALAALAAAATGLASAQEGGTPPGTCAPDARQDSGAIYRICMPPAERYNGDLVIWAHGYQAFNEPLGIPEEQLCGVLQGSSICINDLANLLGFGFATTSYSRTGLAVLEGLADVVDLVDIYTRKHGQPDHVYLVGASEGGLVTVLGIERYPQVFDGGLAMCGPIGDFNIQPTYYGDFRVVFDYFFPGLIPGSATDIPPSLIQGWDSQWENVILPAVSDPANARTVRQLLRVTGAPFQRGDPNTILETIHDALWYSVFATDDAIAQLGGQPFDNTSRRYRGSGDDADLNDKVQRVSASPLALDTIEAFYQTSGELDNPVVTLHTTKDQQVPYEHEILYRRKVRDTGNRDLLKSFRIRRYGHCSIKTAEALLGFALLVKQVSNQPLEGVNSTLQSASDRQEWIEGVKDLNLPVAESDPAAQRRSPSKRR